MALATNTVLDAVQKKIHDDTSEMRNRLISWFNDAVQAVWLERDWKFLKSTSSATAISDNKLAVPSDYGRLLSVSVARKWFLDQRNQLTDEESFTHDIASTSGGYPTGWTEDGSFIYFEPSATGTPTLKYMPIISAYTDNETTVFPDRFRALFVRTLMDAYYEFEADERGIVSIQLNREELNKLHYWENKNNPQTKNTRYIRDYARGHNFNGYEVL